MGQLERYGLYVLCLVIFLILGVAIWGDGAAAKETVGAKVVQQNEKPLKTEDERLDEFEKLLRQQQRETLQKQGAAEKLFEPAKNDDEGKDEKAKTDVTTPPVKATAALRTHTVRDGDNLESIAKRYLGKRQLWHKIVALNPSVSERNLKLGTVLRIPARAKSVAPVHAGTPVRTYVVREGDSAWKIAAKHYGAKKADEYSKRILRENHIRDAGALKTGMKIALPQ